MLIFVHKSRYLNMFVKVIGFCIFFDFKSKLNLVSGSCSSTLEPSNEISFESEFFLPTVKYQTHTHANVFKLFFDCVMVLKKWFLCFLHKQTSGTGLVKRSCFTNISIFLYFYPIWYRILNKYLATKSHLETPEINLGKMDSFSQIDFRENFWRKNWLISHKIIQSNSWEGYV